MSVFSKFLRKHSDDLRSIGDIFSTVFAALPMNKDDKAKVKDAVSSIQSAADNIAKSIAAVEKATDVKLPKADVEKAVRQVVADILPGLVAEVVAKHIAPKEPEA